MKKKEKTRKKIVFITPTFSGGVEFVSISLANYFYLKGYQIYFICF